MKKFALVAIAALSLSVISCKQEANVETTETETAVDSLNAEVDTVAVDTVNANVDSVATDSAVVTETEVK